MGNTMKTAPRFSGPVLAFGIVGLAIILAVSWYGYRRQQAQSHPAPDTSPTAAAAGDNPSSEPTVAVISPAPLRTFDGELPPVVPINLSDTIVEPENLLWLTDKSWLSQPRGTQTLAGVEFHIHGLIQLQSTASVRAKQNYRAQVLVPLTEANLIGDPALVAQLRSNVGCLHLLGALRYGGETAVGTRVADVIWHYEDGTTLRTPLDYSVHIRDWWRTRYEEPERLPYAGAKVVWHGEARSASDRSLRLYRVSLQNPAPGKALQALEFASVMANPALFFVALSLDPLNLGERPDGTPDLEETDPPVAGKLEVYVQTPDGQMLPGARVRALFVQKVEGKTSRVNKSLTADANGMVRFRFADANLQQLDLYAWQDDSEYGGRKMVWDVSTGDVIPPTYTFKLGAGISIGGTVVDETGNPIAEAKLSLGRYWSGGDEMNKKGEQVDFPSRTQTTDASGAWQAKGVPPELLDRISLNVSHPDFVGTNLTVGSNADSEALLRSSTHRFVLRRGLIVRGKVTDENDNPIKDAQVWAGLVNYGGTQDTKTDANGAFSFRNLSEGEKQFSVLAKGRKPEVRKVVVKLGLEEILFKLGPGNVIRGIVKNEAGETVPGVRVALESSSGGVSQEYRFEMTTDQEGRFEWDGAPDESKNFCFLKEGYESKRRQTLKPAEENIITLRKGRKVQAWVVDAETEKPITKFRSGVGRRHDYGDSENFYADYPGMKDYSDANGTFTVDLNEEEVNAIKAEADDYAAKIEKLPAAENGVVQVTLRLKPSASIRGVLVNAQGQPVPGATVALTKDSSMGGSQIQLRKGRLSSYNRDSKIVTTDAEGKFTLGSPPETGGLVVAAAEAGFARATVDEVRNSGRLVLQEFGRVEGSIKIGGSPSAGHEFMFSLMNIGVSPDWETYRTKSDADGRFAFEKMPPGEGQVVRLIKTSPNSWTHSHNTPVTVESGQTARVAFGEEGAVIKGQVRMEVPPGEGEQITFGGSLHTKMPAFNHNFASPEEANAFYKSDEWKEQMKQMKHFGVAVNADGSFSLDSVPPGEYTLSITANKPGSEPWQHTPIASGNAVITVPESASPYAPIGISDIILTPVKK
jgi:uncharacterized GH25 family protein